MQELVHNVFHHLGRERVTVLLGVVWVVHMRLVPRLVTFVDADIQRCGTRSLKEGEGSFVWVPILEPDSAPQSHVLDSRVPPLLADPRQTE